MKIKSKVHILWIVLLLNTMWCLRVVSTNKIGCISYISPSVYPHETGYYSPMFWEMGFLLSFATEIEIENKIRIEI